MTSPVFIRVLALVAIVLIGAATLYFFGPTGPPAKDDSAKPDENQASADDLPPDPRLTFDTPYRNVHPDVQYVGDAACSSCHRALCQSFHQQAMGRSAANWTGSGRIEQFSEAARSKFVSPSGVHYQASEKDGKLLHRESVLTAKGDLLVETTVDASIVIGSGHQARSYLATREGSIWQTGLTWYTIASRWDISPNFSPGMNGQRRVVELCLFCHVDRVDLVPGTLNRYREPVLGRQAHISCERCHGPGALHVAERTAGKMPKGLDTSIVNPSNLSSSLRDDVCAQCHLHGEYISARRGRGHFDYRPGLPLELFRDVFVKENRGEDAFNFVGHLEQLAGSKCSTASAGKMSCTTCHDPHADPGKNGREAYFRQSCLKCHSEKGCSSPPAERQAKNDACAACHMPRRAALDISHTAVTDHRILRRPMPPKAPNASTDPGVLVSYFQAKQFAPSEAERERDLALAYAFLVIEKGHREKPILDLASERLGRTTTRFPSDSEAWTALSTVQGTRGSMNESWSSIERALAIQPNREAALQQGTLVAIQLGKLEHARQFARRAVEINPGNSLNHIHLGLTLQASREWQEAAESLKKGLRDMPLNSGGRAALAVCLYYLGEVPGARRELDIAANLSPNEAASLREWFGQQTR